MLVDVEIEIDGVILAICSVEARRIPHGSSSVPRWYLKAADETWRPAVELPEKLRGPMGDAVVQFLIEERLAAPRHQVQL